VSDGAAPQRLFHGWKIVAGGMLMQSLQSGLFWQAFGAYAALWMADFGWTRTTISWAASLQRTESGLLGPIHGWLLDRTSPRRVFVAGVLLMGAGLIGLAFVQNFTTFMLFYLVASIGSSLCGLLTLMTVVVNWFERRRARALATLQLGISIGSLALPAVAWALVTFGWRPVSVASGLIILAVGLPLARLMHGTPEALGLRPDGGVAVAAAAPANPAAVRVERRRLAHDALRTPAFWLISTGHGLALAIMSAVGVHFVIFAIEVLGLGVTTAATLMAAMTVASVVGQVVGGVAGDRIDKRWLAGGGMLGHAGAMALLMVAGSVAGVAVAALLHGFSWGLRGPLMGAMRADYFGRAAFASVMGYSSLVVMFGSVFGPLVVGFLTDATGSYAPAFGVLTGVGVLGAVAFFALGAPPPPTAAPAPAVPAVPAPDAPAPPAPASPGSGDRLQGDRP
jgi:MFS family permease